MSYPKGRRYEQMLVRHINKHYKPRLQAERVLLSGQRGEGDVMIIVPYDDVHGKVFHTEVKAKKDVPKSPYEWLGKHDLLVTKKIGRQYGWLVTMDLDRFLGLLAQLNRNPHIVDKLPKSESEDEDSVIL